MLVLLLLLPAISFSQTYPDSTTKSQGTDTIKSVPVSAVDTVTVIDTLTHKHSIRKATLLSAVLPGAGQIYNKKYWKLPIIYGAFAGLGYLIHFNNEQFKIYESALIARQDDDPNTVDTEYINKYSDENLRTLSDYYHRNRDLSVVFTVLVYALNIIDAHVDAHLYSFDISDDLSMQVQPTLVPRTYMGMQGYNAGLGINLRF